MIEFLAWVKFSGLPQKAVKFGGGNKLGRANQT
jgi:hypothetical protein